MVLLYLLNSEYNDPVEIMDWWYLLNGEYKDPIEVYVLISITNLLVPCFKSTRIYSLLFWIGKCLSCTSLLMSIVHPTKTKSIRGFGQSILKFSLVTDLCFPMHALYGFQVGRFDFCYLR